MTPARRFRGPSALSMLRPTPLAFIAFLFSYALQVVTNQEAFGIVPYLLLIPSVVLYMLKAVSVRHRKHRLGFDALDAFICTFVGIAVVHIAAALMLGGYGIMEAIRLMLVYAVSGWIYFHVSRSESRNGIRSILMAISFAVVIISLQWMYDTYQKMIRHEITTFQYQSYEYQKRRNNATDEEMNVSALGTQYRAHGLEGSHPLTGTVVGIGAFAVLAASPHAKRRRQFLVVAAFLAVLLVGLATTALAAYLALLPLVLWLYSPGRRVLPVLRRIVLFSSGALILILVAAVSTSGGRKLLENTWTLLVAQVLFVFGLIEGLRPMFSIYGDVVVQYLDFLVHKPIAILFGEGPVGFGAVTFGRGGDVGVLDLAAGFGLPFVVLFYAMCAVAVVRSVEAVKGRRLDRAQSGAVIFGCATIVFLAISFVHYAVIFNKTVIVLFYLAFGLVRRYALPSRVMRRRRVIVPRKRQTVELAMARFDRSSS